MTERTSSHEIMYSDVGEEIESLKQSLKTIEEIVRASNRKLNALVEIQNTLHGHSDFVTKELLDHRKMIYDNRVAMTARLVTIERKIPEKLQKRIKRSCMPILSCFGGN